MLSPLIPTHFVHPYLGKGYKKNCFIVWCCVYSFTIVSYFPLYRPILPFLHMQNYKMIFYHREHIKQPSLQRKRTMGGRQSAPERRDKKKKHRRTASSDQPNQAPIPATPTNTSDAKSRQLVSPVHTPQSPRRTALTANKFNSTSSLFSCCSKADTDTYEGPRDEGGMFGGSGSTSLNKFSDRKIVSPTAIAAISPTGIIPIGNSIASADPNGTLTPQGSDPNQPNPSATTATTSMLSAPAGISLGSYVFLTLPDGTKLKAKIVSNQRPSSSGTSHNSLPSHMELPAVDTRALAAHTESQKEHYSQNKLRASEAPASTSVEALPTSPEKLSPMIGPFKFDESDNDQARMSGMSYTPIRLETQVRGHPPTSPVHSGSTISNSARHHYKMHNQSQPHPDSLQRANDSGHRNSYQQHSGMPLNAVHAVNVSRSLDAIPTFPPASLFVTPHGDLKSNKPRPQSVPPEQTELGQFREQALKHHQQNLGKDHQHLVSLASHTQKSAQGVPSVAQDNAFYQSFSGSQLYNPYNISIHHPMQAQHQLPSVLRSPPPPGSNLTDPSSSKASLDGHMEGSTGRDGSVSSLPCSHSSTNLGHRLPMPHPKLAHSWNHNPLPLDGSGFNNNSSNTTNVLQSTLTQSSNNYYTDPNTSSLHHSATNKNLPRSTSTTQLNKSSHHRSPAVQLFHDSIPKNVPLGPSGRPLKRKPVGGRHDTLQQAANLQQLYSVSSEVGAPSATSIDKGTVKPSTLISLDQSKANAATPPPPPHLVIEIGQSQRESNGMPEKSVSSDSLHSKLE